MNPWSVGVVVPARNEQARIDRCVRSIVTAMDHARVARAWIVVVADRCNDRTVARARTALGPRGEVREITAGSPGTARRLGVETVLETLVDTRPQHLWLANTDADSHVPSDWISQQLALADAGATAVAGIVAVDSFSSHGEHGAELFARHYGVHPDGTHRHVHGANLGIRADVYLDIGGWCDIAVSEDHCLWRRVQEGGWPARASSASVVTTSGRLQGRAHGGFADTLHARLRAARAEASISAATVAI